jgi:hypothetical protein
LTPQITFYVNDAFSGRTFTAREQISNFDRIGFNDVVSSAVVSGGDWEICADAEFQGRCDRLRPGEYASLPLGLNGRVSSARPSAQFSSTQPQYYDTRPRPPVAAGQIVFYEDDGFRGRALSSDREVADFSREGFNDRVSSVVVNGGEWEVCEHAGYGGRCVVLRPGRYASLAAIGLNDRVSSARAAGARPAYGQHSGYH